MKGGIWPFTPKQPASEELTPLNPTAPTVTTEPNRGRPQEAKKPSVPYKGENNERAMTQAALAEKAEKNIALATTLLAASGVAKMLPFGGIISGALILVASAIKTDGNLKRVSAIITEIQHDLIYTYLLFEVIKDSSKKLEIKLDTTIIEEDARALADMITNMFEKDITLAVRLKGQFIRDIELEIHKLEDRVRRLERSMTNLYSSFDILKGNVDVLANVDDKELVDRFRKAAGNQRSGSEFQEISDFIKRKNTPEDNAMQAKLLNSVDQKTGGRRKSRRRRSRKGKTFRRKKQ